MKPKNLLLASTAIALMFFSSACINEGRTDPEKDIATTPENDINIGKIDYAWYDSIDALYEKADFVIKGKVLDSRVEWMSHVIEPTAEEKSDPILNPDGEIDDDKVITTIYTVEINVVYKGSVGKTIEVLQLGGETDTAKYSYEGASEITINKEYILFLSESTLYENAAWLLNNAQALYKVEGNDLIKLPQNTLELTYEDLTRLEKSQ